MFTLLQGSTKDRYSESSKMCVWAFGAGRSCRELENNEVCFNFALGTFKHLLSPFSWTSKRGNELIHHGYGIEMM